MPITDITHISRNLKKVSFKYKGKKYIGQTIQHRLKTNKKVGIFAYVDGKLVEIKL